MYYNTTNETNPELSEYRQKAMKQDDVIMEYFKGCLSYPLLTPSMVSKYVLPNAPITSIRRSLTNLTDKGDLVKTDQKRMGPYGRPEHVWTLPEAAKQMDLI